MYPGRSANLNSLQDKVFRATKNTAKAIKVMTAPAVLGTGRAAAYLGKRIQEGPIAGTKQAFSDAAQNIKTPKEHRLQKVNERAMKADPKPNESIWDPTSKAGQARIAIEWIHDLEINENTILSDNELKQLDKHIQAILKDLRNTKNDNADNLSQLMNYQDAESVMRKISKLSTFKHMESAPDTVAGGLQDTYISFVEYLKEQSDKSRTFFMNLKNPRASGVVRQVDLSVFLTGNEREKSQELLKILTSVPSDGNKLAIFNYQTITGRLKHVLNYVEKRMNVANGIRESRSLFADFASSGLGAIIQQNIIDSGKNLLEGLTEEIDLQNLEHAEILKEVNIGLADLFVDNLDSPLYEKDAFVSDDNIVRLVVNLLAAPLDSREGSPYMDARTALTDKLNENSLRHHNLELRLEDLNEILVAANMDSFIRPLMYLNNSQLDDVLKQVSELDGKGDPRLELDIDQIDELLDQLTSIPPYGMNVSLGQQFTTSEWSEEDTLRITRTYLEAARQRIIDPSNTDTTALIGIPTMLLNRTQKQDFILKNYRETFSIDADKQLATILRKSLRATLRSTEKELAEVREERTKSMQIISGAAKSANNKLVDSPLANLSFDRLIVEKLFGRDDDLTAAFLEQINFGQHTDTIEALSLKDCHDYYQDQTDLTASNLNPEQLVEYHIGSAFHIVQANFNGAKNNLVRIDSQIKTVAPLAQIVKTTILVDYLQNQDHIRTRMQAINSEASEMDGFSRMIAEQTTNIDSAFVDLDKHFVDMVTLSSELGFSGQMGANREDIMLNLSSSKTSADIELELRRQIKIIESAIESNNGIPTDAQLIRKDKLNLLLKAQLQTETKVVNIAKLVSEVENNILDGQTSNNFGSIRVRRPGYDVGIINQYEALNAKRDVAQIKFNTIEAEFKTWQDPSENGQFSKMKQELISDMSSRVKLDIAADMEIVIDTDNELAQSILDRVVGAHNVYQSNLGDGEGFSLNDVLNSFAQFLIHLLASKFNLNFATR